eukprot:jgi/Tetstr1/426853/TSEL_017067.t1
MARVNLASVAVVLLLLGQLPTCSAQGTIVEIASGNEELSTLVAAIEAAGLTETLSGPGPFTVFAPTNSAFAAALSSLGLTAQQLLGNEDRAEDVKYHAIGGAQVMAGDLMNSQVVDTVAELPLGLVVADSGDVKLIHGLQTKATVIDADIVASNGVIHIIDTVLIRPQQTIPELMRDEIPDLSALEQELVQLGLNQTLSGEGPFTVFAPINTAFASLSGELPASVSDIMLYHVSSGISLSGALNSGMLIESLNAYSVGVSIDDSQSEPRTVNLIHGGSAMATVVFADVMATNGIIHLIDAVLLPPSMNIPELAFAIGLTALVSAVNNAGLAETLSGEGPFTVFAPTEDAFEGVELPGDPSEILLYHVLNGTVLSGGLENGMMVPTLNAYPIGVSVSDAGVSIIHGDSPAAMVTTANVMATNGIVHLVNTVLTPPTRNIPELAFVNGLTTLMSAVNNAGLAETLSGEGPFTVFAPTEDAFEGVELPGDPSDILQYHVLNGSVLSGGLENGMIVPTLNVYPIGVSVSDAGVSIIHGDSPAAMVTTANVMATNGIVHLVNTVLTPPTRNIPELAFANGLTTLMSAVNNAGLAETLSGEGPFTVFAPTEDAFEGVELPGDPSDILQYHVLNGRVLSGGLENGMMVPTLNAYPIGVSVSDAGVSIIHGDSPAAMVTTANVMATNGIVHLVNTVLTPPTRNIPELAFANGLTTLMSAVTNAGLAETLSGEGPFTVFAPVDSAFEAMELPADPSDILLHHVLDGIALSSSLENNMFPVTRAKQRLGVAIDSAGEVTLAHASSPMAMVTAVDIMATNGIVHVIDAVLMPPTMTIAEMVEDSDALSTLLAAVQAADLVDTLNNSAGMFTVFAPVNDGATSTLAELGINATALLAAHQLPAILAYHALPTMALSSALTMDMTMPTVEDGLSLEFEVSNNNMDALPKLTPGNIITADVMATNGVVHTVNKMMIPEGIVAELTPTPAPTPAPTMAPTPAPAPAPTPTATPESDDSAATGVSAAVFTILAGAMAGLMVMA